jgi:hypothetical protein
MAELVDALASGASAARRGGSSPLQRTIFPKRPLRETGRLFSWSQRKTPRLLGPGRWYWIAERESGAGAFRAAGALAVTLAGAAAARTAVAALLAATLAARDPLEMAAIAGGTLAAGLGAGARGAADAVDIASGTFGRSKLMTWLTPSTSMPRAAMSVATSTGCLPSRKALERALALALALVAVDRLGDAMPALELADDACRRRAWCG